MGFSRNVCACFGYLLGDRSLWGFSKSSESSRWSNWIGVFGILSFYCRSMDEFGTSSFTDDGGNQTLVFFLPFHYWLDTLFMKYLLEAMMALQDGKMEEAHQNFKEAEMIMIADWFKAVATDFENSKDRVSKEVMELCAKYPIY